MSNAFDKDSANIGLPIPISISILLGSFIFIAWYFIIYPIRLAKRGLQLSDGEIVSKEVVK